MAQSHGSSVLGDAWVATWNDPAPGGELEGAAWRQIPQAPAARPDGRWKSSGDMLPGYFLAFGGDDLTSFLNDLWVLPMGEAQAVAKVGFEVDEHSVDDFDDPGAKVTGQKGSRGETQRRGAG